MTSSAQLEDFRLPASTGHTLSLDSFQGKVPLVLVFLPDTGSDAVALLQEMDRRHKDFGAERAQILAVKKATARQVRELADDHEVSVPILADASGAMARDYDAADYPHAVAVVADKEGNMKRRFTNLLEGNDPGRAVESLLYTIRALGTNTLEPDEEDE
ncbi:MAG TPA: redoxin domain-containing protein [Acidimicrobiia bacterium]